MANEEAATAAPPPKSGKKFLIVVIVFALIAIAAGASLPWVLGGSINEHFGSQKKSAPPPKGKQIAVAFDDVLVNIGEEKLNRYLRIKLMVAIDEVDARDVTELLTQQKAFLKSWLICYLADQSAQDVMRRTGVNRIRREVCDQFNQMLYPNGDGKILDILFDQFVVQQ